MGLDINKNNIINDQSETHCGQNNPTRQIAQSMIPRCDLLYVILICLITMLSFSAVAHTVDQDTKQFLINVTGIHLVAFLYIGADHMLTGYDHLLFLFGVIFLLRKTRDILLYVSLFTLGHSITLLLGVLSQIQVNAYVIDAIIGLSVVYKGFDNLSGFKYCLGFTPEPKIAVFVFGLFHGLGLATKLQEFQLNADGLLANLLAFNLGVEIGQFLALGLLLLLINILRQYRGFDKFSLALNTLLMSCGFMLIGFQLTGSVIN